MEKALALFLAVETSTISNVAKEVKLMLTHVRGLHFDICATGSRRPQQQIEKLGPRFFYVRTTQELFWTETINLYVKLFQK